MSEPIVSVSDLETSDTVCEIVLEPLVNDSVDKEVSDSDKNCVKVADSDIKVVLDNIESAVNSDALDNEPAVESESAVLDIEVVTDNEVVVNIDALDSEAVIDNEEVIDNEAVLDNEPAVESESVVNANALDIEVVPDAKEDQIQGFTESISPKGDGRSSQSEERVSEGDSYENESEPEIYLEDVYKEPELTSDVTENITISFETIEHPAELEIIIPNIVFIVPYRDRQTHYNLFSSHMKSYLSKLPTDSYQILYIHQNDSRSFNRGAMKNIGFIAVKDAFPNHYKNITLVFNDVDTMPSNSIDIQYETTPGVIKHFYGFNYTLGGIVSVNAYDFERLNGFPNFWAWGYEDNMFQTRAENANLKIDRSVFYKIHDPNIIHLMDTPIREVNRTEFQRFLNKTTEGISSIHGLKYVVDDSNGFVDVLQFETTVSEVIETRVDYDLRNGPAPFQPQPVRTRRPRMRMIF